MCFKSFSEHTEPLFKKLRILNIFKINDFVTSLIMLHKSYKRTHYPIYTATQDYLHEIFMPYVFKMSIAIH